MKKSKTVWSNQSSGSSLTRKHLIMTRWCKEVIRQRYQSGWSPSSHLRSLVLNVVSKEGHVMLHQFFSMYRQVLEPVEKPCNASSECCPLPHGWRDPGGSGKNYLQSYNPWKLSQLFWFESRGRRLRIGCQCKVDQSAIWQYKDWLDVDVLTLMTNNNVYHLICAWHYFRRCITAVPQLRVVLLIVLVKYTKK